MKKIQFNTVFEASKAGMLFNWERDHKFGVLIFEVTEKQYDLLKENNIGFFDEEENQVSDF
ncbi:MAG: hypothetical protein H0U27_04340 [Nitrosopumilus sp.]|nr:hypothetical protein [Nitrosopumilus sp.]